jgi:hypothetical protein
VSIHLALLIMSFSYYIFSFTKDISSIHFPFLLLISFLPFYLIYKVKVDESRPKNGYRVLFKFCFFIIIINTLFYGLFNYTMGETIASFGIYSQVIAAYYLSKLNFDFFMKNFEIVAIISIVLIPFLISTASINVDTISNRETVQDSFYRFAGSFWVALPLVLFAVIYNRKLKLAFLLWAVTILLNLLFLKRFIIIDSLLLMISIVFYQLSRKKKLFNKVNLLIMLSVAVLIYFLSTSQSLGAALNATMGRMNDQTVDVEGFDRFRETNSYLADQANFFDIIIGRGFAGQHHGFTGESISLHTGWGNFILKGGVLLLSLVVIAVGTAIRLLFKFKKLPAQLKFSVLYVVIQGLRFSYTNMHNYRPELLIFFCAVFVIMDYYQAKSYKAI